MITFIKEKKTVSINQVDDLLHRMLVKPAMQLQEKELEVASILESLATSPGGETAGRVNHAIDPIHSKKTIIRKAALVLQQWQLWRARNEIYSITSPSTLWSLPTDEGAKRELNEAKTFNRYFSEMSKQADSEHVKDILRKMADALQCIHELTDSHSTASRKIPLAAADEMLEVLLDSLLKDLLKLDINQLEFLADKQKVRHETLRQKKAQLTAKKDAINDQIQGKKIKFSDIAGKERPTLHNYFRKHEKRIHFRKHVEYFTQTNKGLSFTTSLLGYGLKIGIAASAAALKMVSWVSNITYIIPTLINEILKPSMKRKNLKFLISIGATLFFTVSSTIIIGIKPILADISPVFAAVIPIITAVTSYVSFGMAAIYFIKNNIYPLVESLRELHERNKEIKRLDTLLLDSAIKFPLNKLQKQVLLLKLEKTAASLPINNGKGTIEQIQKHNAMAKYQIIQARKAIVSGNEKTLLENPLIQLMMRDHLVGSKTNKDAFTSFMHAEIRQYKAIQEQDILQIKKEAFIQGISAVASILLLVSATAVMATLPVAIPVILGLLGTGIMIAKELKLFDKLANKLFGITKPIQDETVSFDSSEKTILMGLTKDRHSIIEPVVTEVVRPVVDLYTDTIPYPPVSAMGIMSCHEKQPIKQEDREFPELVPFGPSVNPTQV